MKAINTSLLNNVIYADFKAKNPLTENEIYNKCHDKWMNIKRADDNSKVIVAEAILYIASFEFLFLKNQDEIIFDKDLLLKKAIKGKKQRGRYLKQIADIYEIEYHTKYIYKEKIMRCIFSAKRTENSLKILENPKLFYESEVVKNGSISSQKSPPKGSNLTPSIIEHVEGKDPIGLFPSTVNTTAGVNSARGNKTANQNITPVESMLEPQQLISQSQTATTSFECSSQSEIATNQIVIQQTKLSELRREIAKIFSVKTAQALAYESIYTELATDKIAVRLGENVKLTDHDKERLRECIKVIYGENVQIVTNQPKQASKPVEPLANTGFDTTVAKKTRTKRKFQEKSKNEDSVALELAISTEQIAAIIPYISATSIWDKVRQALVEKHGLDLVNTRFKRLEITEQEGMITFTGPLSNTYLVANNFDQKLQECSELYDVTFKLVGICQITGTLEERIIKSWYKGEQ